MTSNQEGFSLQTQDQPRRDRFILLSAGLLLFAWWSIYLMAALLDEASLRLAFEVGPDETVLLSLGAKVDPLVAAGEVHRLVLSAFLHSGVEHLVINSLWLVILAWIFRRVGKSGVGFTLVFLVGAIAGQSASFGVSLGPSVGASGGIYALLGSLLMTAWANRSDRFSRGLIVIVCLLFLVSPLFWSRVDHAAHLAGMLVGIIVTRLRLDGSAKKLRERVVIAVVIFSLGLLAMGLGLPQKHLDLPEVQGTEASFSLARCQGLGATGPVPCVREPSLAFAARMTMKDLEALGSPGAHTIPAVGTCHTVTVSGQNMAIRRIDSERLAIVATDAGEWPRFQAAVRRFIGGRCPGT